MKDDNRQLIPDLNLQIKADLQSIEARSTPYFESCFPMLFNFPIETFIQEDSYNLFPEGHMVSVGKLESEVHMAEYLNNIVAAVRSFPIEYNVSAKRGNPLCYWSAGHCNKTIGIGPWRAKPDLVLVQLYGGSKLLNDDQVFWPDVLAVGEATVTHGPTERMEQVVNTRSFLMSYSQGIHEFIYHYKNIPAPPPNAPQSELVVETVYSYTDNDAAETNKLDSADLRWNLAANLATITCHHQLYDIIEELFKSEALFGRGTRVWLVSGRSDRLRIVKDSNVLKSHKRTEAAFLTYLNACSKLCPYIPTLVGSEILDRSESRRDPLLFVPCTEGLSAIAATKHIEHLSGAEALSEMDHREQRRLIIDAIGKDLSEVKSKIKLLGVILDITRAIQFLGEHNAAHRDISYNNIMLCTQALSASEKIAFGRLPGTTAKVSLNSRIKAECRPGLLIDFDFAGFLDPSLRVSLLPHKCRFTNGLGPTSPTSVPPTSKSKVAHEPLHVNGMGKNNSGYGARTGTAPFMALPLLLHSAPHKIGFDLENFGRLRDGKGILVRDNHYAPISAWFNPHLSFVDLGHLKASQVHLHIEHSIFKYISTTFHDLKPTMKKLWQALYPSVQSVSNQVDTTSNYAALLEVAQLQPQDACESFITILEEEISCLFAMGNIKKRPSSRQANYDEADYADTLPSPTISKLDNAATVNKHVTFISRLVQAISSLAASERVPIDQVKLTEDYRSIKILVGEYFLTLSGRDLDMKVISEYKIIAFSDTSTNIQVTNILPQLSMLDTPHNLSSMSYDSDDFSDGLDDIVEIYSPRRDAPRQKRATECTEQLPALSDDEHSEPFTNFKMGTTYERPHSVLDEWDTTRRDIIVLPNDSLQLTAILKKENNHIRNELRVARDQLAEVTKERDGLVVAQAALHRPLVESVVAPSVASPVVPPIARPAFTSHDSPLARNDRICITFTFRWLDSERARKDSGDTKKGKSRSPGKNITMRYVVGQDSIPVNGNEAKKIRHYAHALWGLYAEHNICPLTWMKASSDVMQHYRNSMNTKYPDLRLCEDNWKSEQITIDNYPSWYAIRFGRKEKAIKTEPHVAMAIGEASKRPRSPSVEP
ncbi:hypothetical protein DXG01_015506 [Tephrocybe rancida]|nr:hypothetical protein DXG01_015506 [Tephrocybe rancida]